MICAGFGTLGLIRTIKKQRIRVKVYYT